MYSIIILYIYEHGFESDIEGGSLLGRGPSGLPTYEPASQVGPRLRVLEEKYAVGPRRSRDARPFSATSKRGGSHKDDAASLQCNGREG